MKIVHISSHHFGIDALIRYQRGFGLDVEEMPVASSLSAFTSGLAGGSVVHFHGLSSLARPNTPASDALSLVASLRERDIKVVMTLYTESETWRNADIAIPGAVGELSDLLSYTLLGSEEFYVPIAARSRWAWQALPVDVAAIPVPPLFEPSPHEVRVLYMPYLSNPADTRFIEATVSAVWNSGLKFKFTVVSPDEMKEERWYTDAFAHCDLFIESIDREGFGPAAVEAMLRGKTVMSGNAPEGKHLWPQLNVSPVFNTTRANFERRLESIIREPRCLRDLGKRSRQYVEQYHNAERIAAHLVDIYREL